jgi:DNA-binding LacI/PurR family transcriptional regulator
MRHFRQQQRHATVQREQGYLAGLRRHGLEPVPTYTRYLDPAEHVDVFLKMKPPPTALVASSDGLALQMVAALLRRGVRVPEDMSIVGHDGVGSHEHCVPRLTTVVVPVEEMGRTAVWILQHEIEQDKPVSSVVLPETLDVNGSTAPVVEEG